jgi:cation/acetate symporter
VNNKENVNVPSWFTNWEKTGLIVWADKNGDGLIQYRYGDAFEGNPEFESGRGAYGQRLISNELTDSENELFIDRDIMVLANPEIAQLPNWVVGLVAAGGLAAALSTAAGLLLVISTSISHDLLKKIVIPGISEKQELLFARIAAGVTVVLSGYFGVHPPGFVAQVVAFAFGLAASSFFPAIFLGIFSKRMNKQGAISGMLAGITFTASYIIYYKFINPAANIPGKWLFGISPEGIGAVGMVINFVIAFLVSSFTAPPPENVQALVEEIRIPKGAKKAHEINA